jgi:hypothetical protein
LERYLTEKRSFGGAGSRGKSPREAGQALLNLRSCRSMTGNLREA